VGVGLVHDNNLLPCCPVWGGGPEIAGTLLGPETTPQGRGEIHVVVLSRHFGGGVWCLVIG
jgi:hypothetical protein